MEEKSLKIVFLKIHTFDKNLGKESIQRFEEKKEEIESQYALELASIEEQKEYKSIISKKVKETSDIILDELEKAREKIFVKLVKQINNKREKGLQELEKVVYGNQEPEIAEEYGKRYSEGFVIRCIYYVEKEELEQELKKLVSQLATNKISKVSYHRYLQLKVVRLKDSDTFKEEIKIEIYNIESKEKKPDYNGCICSNLSDLDKKLIELIDYGTELGRQEIADIRRIIRSNYSYMPVKATDLVDAIKLSYICDYIVETGLEPIIMKTGKNSGRKLYLIDSKDFDKEFAGYKNIIDFRNTLIQEGIMIASRGRGKYKHTDQKYYIAIDADLDRVKKTIDGIKGVSEPQKTKDEKKNVQ